MLSTRATNLIYHTRATNLVKHSNSAKAPRFHSHGPRQLLKLCHDVLAHRRLRRAVCRLRRLSVHDRYSIEISSNLQLSRSQKAHKPQSATNAKGTLYGENMGDFIVLQWALNDFAAEYFVYRSTSASGTWEQLGRMSDAVARTSGSKIDETPDARKMDLCYKVEAINTLGQVIRTYQPMCVPKFDQGK
jgi:hypothetical protein